MVREFNKMIEEFDIIYSMPVDRVVFVDWCTRYKHIICQLGWETALDICRELMRGVSVDVNYDRLHEWLCKKSYEYNKFKFNIR